MLFGQGGLFGEEAEAGEELLQAHSVLLPSVSGPQPLFGQKGCAGGGGGGKMQTLPPSLLQAIAFVKVTEVRREVGTMLVIVKPVDPTSWPPLCKQFPRTATPQPRSTAAPPPPPRQPPRPCATPPPPQPPPSRAGRTILGPWMTVCLAPLVVSPNTCANLQFRQ